MTTRACADCGKSIPLPVTEAQIEHWRNSGALIQKALPQLTPDQRELLISGICGGCFEAMFT